MEDVNRFNSATLFITNTLHGYVVFQNHPLDGSDYGRRTPIPVAGFETKEQLLMWMATNWVPNTPLYHVDP